MKVVCAACNKHYADIGAEDFAEQLVLSDALALYHMGQCQASASDKDDAWNLMESISKADAEAVSQ